MVQTATVRTEGALDAEFLESEAKGRRSRDEITLAQDADYYEAGTVLKVSGANMVRFDGTGDAAGILLNGVDASAAAAAGVAIVRDAEVTLSRLVFLDAATQGHKDAAVATFATAGVISR